MSSLHLSLLILAIAVLIALYLIGRHKANADRPKPTRKRRKREVPGSSVKTPPHAAEAADQMDLWKKAPGNGATGGEASGSGTGFDEFGVGQPRRRGEPRLDPILTGQRAAAVVPETVADSEPDLPPAPPEYIEEPAMPAEAVSPEAVAAAPVPATPEPPEPPKALDEKIVAFYIAEREGTYIDGVQIHRALQSAGLRYGDKMKIYERVASDAQGRSKTVFGVASLLKPGHLDPAEASEFSTPGLSMFMVLPGPVAAERAYEDFLETGRELAEALNAQLYDTKRAPLTEALAAQLRTEVQGWATDNE